MNYHYPTPEEVGIRIPPHLIPERFEEGFLFSIKGGQLRRGKHFRKSFREGFRAGRLFLREYRRRHNIIEFPMKAKMKFTASSNNLIRLNSR